MSGLLTNNRSKHGLAYLMIVRYFQIEFKLNYKRLTHVKIKFQTTCRQGFG